MCRGTPGRRGSAPGSARLNRPPFCQVAGSKYVRDSRVHAAATVEWKIFTAVMHRDNDLTGSVDHAQWHAACARRPSLYGRRACEAVERTTGRGTAMGLNWLERREKHHFFPSKRNKEQTRHVLVGTIYFPLMLVAIRNLVELLSSFSPSSWRGQLHARRRPHLFQWRTREKVLGGTKSECVLSAAQR